MSASRSPTFKHLGASGLLVLALVAQALAQHHHDEQYSNPYESEYDYMRDEPVDKALRWQLGLQGLAWGITFPIGMVLGLTRHRLHIPVQTCGIIITLLASWIGSGHAGPTFQKTAYNYFCGYLLWYLAVQIFCGLFIRSRIWQGSRTRRIVIFTHGFIGKSFPVVGWAQMVLGGIAALGFCVNDHLGQCLAHFIMGSGFIAYGMILLLMLRVGAGFLARRRMSQEYLDSWVILVWGMIEAFTTHDLLETSGYWSHKDMQHVSIGVLWWAGGALGIFLSRNGKRSIIPSLVVAMTGLAMSSHDQGMMFSMMIHKVFGVSLMGAAVARIVEICFLLQDAPTPVQDETSSPRAFQHLPPFLLVLAGLTLMSATEEQIAWVAASGMDYATYTNILISTSFVIYLTGAGLLELYEYLSRRANGPTTMSDDLERGDRSRKSWHGITVTLPSFLSGPSSSRRNRGYETIPLAGSMDQDDHHRPASPESPNSPDTSKLETGSGSSTIFDAGDGLDGPGGNELYWKMKEAPKER